MVHTRNGLLPDWVRLRYNERKPVEDSAHVWERIEQNRNRLQREDSRVRRELCCKLVGRRIAYVVCSWFTGRTSDIRQEQCLLFEAKAFKWYRSQHSFDLHSPWLARRCWRFGWRSPVHRQISHVLLLQIHKRRSNHPFPCHKLVQEGEEERQRWKYNNLSYRLNCSTQVVVSFNLQMFQEKEVGATIWAGIEWGWNWA